MVRIKEMKSQTEIHEPEQVRNIDKSSSSDSDSASSNKEIDFDSYLDTIEQAKVKRHRSENAAAVDIKNTRFQQDFFGALMEVEKFDRSSKVTVEEAIPAYPEIVKDVARAVTAMPPTQASLFKDTLNPRTRRAGPEEDWYHFFYPFELGSGGFFLETTDEKNNLTDLHQYDGILIIINH
ncbi:hypothetical protein Hamer_G011023 [Homarus americanus]|uniref:Uncharacterized protein n=1 Tax=Homarus americanus TaxID=6706 RepID=A0A8J5JX17_HOMAM|nr:hypothetical protein Hamer_G011023 [Homarus americanus]